MGLPRLSKPPRSGLDRQGFNLGSAVCKAFTHMPIGKQFIMSKYVKMYSIHKILKSLLGEGQYISA